MSLKPYDENGGRWYRLIYKADVWPTRKYQSARVSTVIAVILLGLVAVSVPIVAGGMLMDRSACETKMVARPEFHYEWHWQTGCISTNGSNVVVSR